MKTFLRFLGVSLVVLGIAPALADGAAARAILPAGAVNAPPRDNEDSTDGEAPPSDGVTDPVDDGYGDEGTGDDPC